MKNLENLEKTYEILEVLWKNLRNFQYGFANTSGMIREFRE